MSDSQLTLGYMRMSDPNEGSSLQESPSYELDQQNRIHFNSTQPTAKSHCKNTEKEYNRRQKKFIDFCDRKGYESGRLVTEEKLIDFLREVVVSRGNIQRSKKGEFRDDGTPYPLSASSIEQYIKAIVDLFNIQKLDSSNTAPMVNPRGALLKSYLRLLNPPALNRRQKPSLPKPAHPEPDPTLNILFNQVHTINHKIDRIFNCKCSQPNDQHNAQDIAELKAALENINQVFNQLKAACALFAHGFFPPAPSPALFTSVNSNSVPPSPLSSSVSPVVSSASSVASQITSSLQVADSSSANKKYVYKMQRWVKTVPDLWREFTVGLNGHPSINYLNTMYRSSWRSEGEEKRMYSRRITIIEKIKQVSKEDNVSIADAIAHLENRRISQNLSLGKLNELLQREM